MTPDSKVNILLVEHRPDNRVGMQQLLGELGENLIVASSGPEALAAVQRHDFAVILLAADLPSGQGEETAGLLHRNERSAATPILFLASAADEQQQARAYALGAADYLGSPVNPEILRAKLRLYVQLFRRAATAQGHAAERAAQLEAQAARLAAEAAQRQSESETRKNEFLAMLAHELRNPLAAIRGAVHVLCLSDLGKDKVAWARAIIDRQVNQLVRLVDDLLDVARITQGKIRLQVAPVDITAVVELAKELSGPILEARHHQLAVSSPKGPLWVRGDSARLAQVLSNLLSNAAKYTDAGGHIELLVQREAEQVLVQVRDNGVGIPAEMIGIIFDLFTQANRSLDRAQGGLGIGLTLVRHIVEMHGGSVGVTSAGQNQGSQFSIRLPRLPEPQQPQAQSDSAPPADNPQRRVLVVDDNLDVADSLALMLKQRGHEVCLAHNGPAAISAAKTFCPQVVLLDIGLPGLDGYEVARRLRAMPELAGAFLVAITGYGQPEARRTANQAGFDVHLVKPVDPQALDELLARIPALPTP